MMNDFLNDPRRLSECFKSKSGVFEDFQIIDAEIIDYGVCEEEYEPTPMIPDSPPRPPVVPFVTSTNASNINENRPVNIKLDDYKKHPRYNANNKKTNVERKSFSTVKDVTNNSAIGNTESFKSIDSNKMSESVIVIDDDENEDNTVKQDMRKTTINGFKLSKSKKMAKTRMSNFNKFMNNAEVEKVTSQNSSTEIDFKKNKGLVGLKIQGMIVNDKAKECNVLKRKAPKTTKKMPKKIARQLNQHVKTVDTTLSNMDTTVLDESQTQSGTKDTKQVLKKQNHTFSMDKYPEKYNSLKSELNIPSPNILDGMINNKSDNLTDFFENKVTQLKAMSHSKKKTEVDKKSLNSMNGTNIKNQPNMNVEKCAMTSIDLTCSTSPEKCTNSKKNITSTNNYELCSSSKNLSVINNFTKTVLHKMIANTPKIPRNIKIKENIKKKNMISNVPADLSVKRKKTKPVKKAMPKQSVSVEAVKHNNLSTNGSLGDYITENKNIICNAKNDSVFNMDGNQNMDLCSSCCINPFTIHNYNEYKKSDCTDTLVKYKQKIKKLITACNATVNIDTNTTAVSKKNEEMQDESSTSNFPSFNHSKDIDIFPKPPNSQCQLQKVVEPSHIKSKRKQSFRIMSGIDVEMYSNINGISKALVSQPPQKIPKASQNYHENIQDSNAINKGTVKPPISAPTQKVLIPQPDTIQSLKNVGNVRRLNKTPKHLPDSYRNNEDCYKINALNTKIVEPMLLKPPQQTLKPKYYQIQSIITGGEQRPIPNTLPTIRHQLPLQQVSPMGKNLNQQENYFFPMHGSFQRIPLNVENFNPGGNNCSQNNVVHQPVYTAQNNPQMLSESNMAPIFYGSNGNMYWPYTGYNVFPPPPPLPPPQAPPPPQDLPQYVDKTSVIGVNTDGVVEKIQVTAPTTISADAQIYSKEGIVKQEFPLYYDKATPQCPTPVMSETKMMTELEKARVNENPVCLTRPSSLERSDVQVMHVTRYKPGPLSKRLSLNEKLSLPENKNHTLPSKGYSLPILPILTD